MQDQGHFEVVHVFFSAAIKCALIINMFYNLKNFDRKHIFKNNFILFLKVCFYRLLYF